MALPKANPYIYDTDDCSSIGRKKMPSGKSNNDSGGLLTEEESYSCII